MVPWGRASGAFSLIFWKVGTTAGGFDAGGGGVGGADVTVAGASFFVNPASIVFGEEADDAVAIDGVDDEGSEACDLVFGASAGGGTFGAGTGGSNAAT